MIVTTPLTEQQIERVVEHETNVLDRLLLRGALTQSKYDEEIIKLDQWAECEYHANRKSYCP